MTLTVLWIKQWNIFPNHVTEVKKVRWCWVKCSLARLRQGCLRSMISSLWLRTSAGSSRSSLFRSSQAAGAWCKHILLQFLRVLQTCKYEHSTCTSYSCFWINILEAVLSLIVNWVEPFWLFTRQYDWRHRETITCYILFFRDYLLL